MISSTINFGLIKTLVSGVFFIYSAIQERLDIISTSSREIL